MSWTQCVRDWARRVKRDSVTLWFAAKHPETPWVPKALCALVVAYALSPIDLIPDFVPVLGYVDEALLLPALIRLAVRMVPQQVLEVSRAQADEWLASKRGKPRSHIGAAFVLGIWLATAVAAGYWLRDYAG